MKGITTDELNEIYDPEYCDAVQGEALPAGVDYALFDGAVNSARHARSWVGEHIGCGS